MVEGISLSEGDNLYDFLIEGFVGEGEEGDGGN